jgi:hypothetical protein
MTHSKEIQRLVIRELRNNPFLVHNSSFINSVSQNYNVCPNTIKHWYQLWEHYVYFIDNNPKKIDTILNDDDILYALVLLDDCSTLYTKELQYGIFLRSNNVYSIHDIRLMGYTNKRVEKINLRGNNLLRNC